MSNPRDIWWSYAKAMVRQYPQLEADLAELQKQKMTASYEAQEGGRSSGEHRPTELTAMRCLPEIKQREHDAVQQAIDMTMLYPNGESRMRMINMVYWRRTHTLEMVAYELHYSYRTVKEWHREFIRCVGAFAGLT